MDRSTTDGPEEALSERAQLLLKALIENYIRDGQPVGSRTLSRDSGLSLSSATIRNVMADLEDLGFVASPHTSAGRVPTDKGYRFFVDTLLKLKPLRNEEIEDIERRLGSEASSGRSLVQTVSQMLSSVTHMAGLVTLPNPNYVALAQIEFIALSENRALAIMVMSNREIQNRVVQLDRHHSSEELRRAANYLNEAFAGRSLPDVRSMLVRQLQETREHMDKLMRDAIQVAQKVFESDAPEGVEYVIAGETNLMGFAELSNIERLKRLFEAFNEKHDILRLLDNCLQAQGIQIFIGQESGYRILDDISVVTAPYTLDNRVVGVLGIIGPTRMAYERVIPIVDLTAKLLGSALNARK
ncbi:MAG TPA: heat-inducible transcriptional repressor HrcA [Steroidobacteraceae bacterium]|jgi:heat-inducible transcriptional repressor|nr:heat-inducible transcriptional repressor HrcA [Steroidobacteraceae bacterium]